METQQVFQKSLKSRFLQTYPEKISLYVYTFKLAASLHHQQNQEELKALTILSNILTVREIPGFKLLKQNRFAKTIFDLQIILRKLQRVLAKFCEVI